MDYVKHMCEVSVARPISGEGEGNRSRVKRIQLNPETTFLRYLIRNDIACCPVYNKTIINDDTV